MPLSSIPYPVPRDLLMSFDDEACPLSKQSAHRPPRRDKETSCLRGRADVSKSRQLHLAIAQHSTTRRFAGATVIPPDSPHIALDCPGPIAHRVRATGRNQSRRDTTKTTCRRQMTVLRASNNHQAQGRLKDVRPISIPTRTRDPSMTRPTGIEAVWGRGRIVYIPEGSISSRAVRKAVKCRHPARC